LFEDEFSLSNTATMGYMWSKVGCQPKVKSKQKKQERMTGMGSYNFETGQITVSFHDKGNYKSLIKHLKKILKIYKKTQKSSSCWTMLDITMPNCSKNGWRQSLNWNWFIYRRILQN
jgi:hypothetical protein